MLCKRKAGQLDWLSVFESVEYNGWYCKAHCNAWEFCAECRDLVEVGIHVGCWGMEELKYCNKCLKYVGPDKNICQCTPKIVWEDYVPLSV